MSQRSLNKFRFRLLLAWLRLKKIFTPPHQTNQSQPHKLLVIATTLLGDLMMMSPAVVALHERFPKARITLVVRPAHIEVARLIRGCDEVIGFAKDTTLLRQLDRRIRDEQYDAAYALLDKKMVRIIHAISRVPIHSYVDKRGRQKKMIAYPVSPPDKLMHMVHLGLRVAGAETIPKAPFLECRSTADHGMPNEKYVVIHPGARFSTRLWAIEKYQAVAKQLIADGYNLAVTGSAPEHALAASLCESLPPSRVINFAGKLSLLGVAELMSKASLVIGPDTGILHMAKALARPTVILEGPSQHEVFGPDAGLYANTHSLHLDNLPCRDKRTILGYYFPGFGTCGRPECLFAEHMCMKNFGADDVIKLARTALNLST